MATDERSTASDPIENHPTEAEAEAATVGPEATEATEATEAEATEATPEHLAPDAEPPAPPAPSQLPPPVPTAPAAELFSSQQPSHPELRVGTVVWGFVIAAIGIGLIAGAAGAHLDVELSLIVLLAGAGAALLVGALFRSRRAHRGA